MTTPTQDMRNGGGPAAAMPGPTLLGLLSLLQPQYRWTRKLDFAYVTEFLPLTANLAIQNTIGIAGDSDFIIVFANCIVTDVTNLIQLPFIPQLVQLIDSAAGVSFFSQPKHAMLVYGEAATPGISSSPIVMRQATQLAVQHTNLEAVNRNVRCSFDGFKSYPGTDTRQARWQG